MYYVARFNRGGNLFTIYAPICTADYAASQAQKVANDTLEQVTLLRGDSFDTALAVADFMPRVTLEVVCDCCGDRPILLFDEGVPYCSDCCK
jgi:hypothetical protein